MCHNSTSGTASHLRWWQRVRGRRRRWSNWKVNSPYYTLNVNPRLLCNTRSIWSGQFNCSLRDWLLLQQRLVWVAACLHFLTSVPIVPWTTNIPLSHQNIEKLLFVDRFICSKRVERAKVEGELWGSVQLPLFGSGRGLIYGFQFEEVVLTIDSILR